MSRPKACLIWRLTPLNMGPRRARGLPVQDGLIEDSCLTHVGSVGADTPCLSAQIAVGFQHEVGALESLRYARLSVSGHLCTWDHAGRVGFQYEMGALESLAAGADVGAGRSVNIMLDSTAEVQDWYSCSLSLCCACTSVIE